MSICVGILSYWLLTTSGISSFHTQLVTTQERTYITFLLKSPKFRTQYQIYQVNKLTFKPVKPRKCS